MNRWIKTTVTQPEADQPVWTIRTPFFDTPVLMTYSSAIAEFLWTDAIGNTLTIPSWQIFAWRPQSYPRLEKL